MGNREKKEGLITVNLFQRLLKAVNKYVKHPQWITMGIKILSMLNSSV